MHDLCGCLHFPYLQGYLRLYMKTKSYPVKPYDFLRFVKAGHLFGGWSWSWFSSPSPQCMIIIGWPLPKVSIWGALLADCKIFKCLLFKSKTLIFEKFLQLFDISNQYREQGLSCMQGNYKRPDNWITNIDMLLTPEHNKM